MHAAQLIDSSGNISLRKSTYEVLKRFRNENPFTRHFYSKFFCMNSVDILLLGETKLDYLYFRCTVFIESCNKPLHADVSGRSRGPLVFTKSYLPTRKLTKLKFLVEIQSTDLVRINKKYYCKNANVFETGLSECHLLIYTILKTSFQKNEPKILVDRDYILPFQGLIIN